MDTLFDTLPDGISIFRSFLTRQEQIDFVQTCRRIACKSPLAYPRMYGGNPFKVRVTSVGSVGWWADENRGFGYLHYHPVTGNKWTPMPRQWREFARRAALEAGCRFEPDTCLINFYAPYDGKLGLHQDENERDLTQPIVTLSLGDSCVFQIGGMFRSIKPQEVRLESGDVLVMHGTGRNLYHGVAEIVPGTSDLLKDGGRVSLTFRKAL